MTHVLAEAQRRKPSYVPNNKASIGQYIVTVAFQTNMEINAPSCKENKDQLFYK